MKITKIRVIVALIILAGALVWLWQSNSYSREVVKLEIIAPSSTVMAEEVTYVVRYKNNGDVRLENPTLVFEYPPGALPLQGGATRVTAKIDDVYPGQERNASFRARLFGKEGDVLEARAQLEYTLQNLSAQFDAETTTATVISRVPVTFELDLPSRMESGQEFTFDLNYFSNSSYPLSNLRIQMEYPQGFTFKSATPSPIGSREWDIGMVNRTEGGRITVRGVLQGAVQETKEFTATLGTFKEGQLTLLKEANRGVEIARPQLRIEQEVNGSAGTVASPGDTLHYVVSFRNGSGKNLENLNLRAALEGKAYDLSSVQPGAGGEWRAEANTLVFSSENVPALQLLRIGQEGQVEFWVDLKDSWDVSRNEKNFTANTAITLADVTQSFEVKIDSGLSVEQRVFFEDEVFGNTGPIPPNVASDTTYTVTWLATNPYNDVNNAKARAVLSPGVALTGNVFPQETPVTYDAVSREVVWDMGDLSAGTGVFSASPSLSFQISFTPSASQVGSAPQLIGPVTISGLDLFTEREVSRVDAGVTTQLLDDGSLSPQDGVVQ